MASQSDRLAQLLEAKKVFDKSAEAIEQLVTAGVIDAAQADAEHKKAKEILDNVRNAALQDNGQMCGDGVVHSPNKRKRTDITNIAHPAAEESGGRIAALDQRTCGVCGESGHNRRTCPQAKGGGTSAAKCADEREPIDLGGRIADAATALDQRTCGVCGQSGHNKRTCPQAKGGGTSAAKCADEGGPIARAGGHGGSAGAGAALDEDTADGAALKHIEEEDWESPVKRRGRRAGSKNTPRTDLEDLRLPTLQAICQNLGLAKSGNKLEIMERIHRESGSTAAKSFKTNLEGLHLETLRLICKERGLAVSGSKVDLLGRILPTAFATESRQADSICTDEEKEEAGNRGAEEPDNIAGARTSVPPVPHKRVATKYNLFLKEKLEEMKQSRPKLDHKQRFAEAARLWRQQSTCAPSACGGESMHNNAGALGSQPYKCRKCGQLKKGHSCPAAGESDLDDDVVVVEHGQGQGDEPGSDSSDEPGSDSSPGSSHVGSDSDQELLDEALGPAASNQSMSSQDVEEANLSDEQKAKNEEILAQALADVRKIVDAGGRFNFDVADLFRKHLADWTRLLSGNFNKLDFSEIKESVAGGRTQTGKTAFKVALAILGWRCGVTTIVITTTASSRDKICADINERYLSFLPEGERPLCLNISQPGERKEHKAKLQQCVVGNGVIIVNLTSAAVDKARKLLQEVRGAGKPVAWALIKDESDTMDRTADEEADPIQLERALHRITGKEKTELGTFFGGPCSILSVTATLVPIFIRIYKEGKANVDVFMIVPDGAEYCGLGPDDMQPSFLTDYELTHKKNDAVAGRMGWSYWSKSVDELYRDAHPEDAQQQKEGVLLLDAANIRVRAADNIIDRAQLVQEHFPRFTVIAVSGSGGMMCRFPGSKWLNKDDIRSLVRDQASSGKAFQDVQDSLVEPAPRRDKVLPYPSISELLTAIVERRGLEPIAVIGYSRLLRGESFVSSSCNINGAERRIVPTHFLCGLGPGRSIEDLVQMAGRVTFNGRNALRANLGAEAKVKILIHFRDWDMALAYYRFQDEVCKRLMAGKSMDEVMKGIGEKYHFASDFLACKGGLRSGPRKRPIGAIKRKNLLGATFENQGEASAELAKYFPGRAWAQACKWLSYDKHGMPWCLDSPIPSSETMLFNETGSIIERYLYHEGNHFNPIAVMFRRALFIAKSSWEHATVLDNQCDNPGEPYEFSKDDKIKLMKDLPVLRKHRDAVGYVGKLNNKFSDAQAFHRGNQSSEFTKAGQGRQGFWSLEPLTWPIFEEVHNGTFVLHEEVLRFAERFNTYLISRPPLQTFEEIEKFYFAQTSGDKACPGVKQRELLFPHHPNDLIQDLRSFEGEVQPIRASAGDAPLSHNPAARAKSDTRPPLTFEGQVLRVAELDQVEEACRILHPGKTTGTLGLDLVWQASQFIGNSSGTIALLSLCSETVCAVFHLHSLQCVPPALSELLQSSRLAGCGIKTKLSRLVKDYGTGHPQFRNWDVVELSDLANSALMVKRKWRLAKLVDRVIVDRFLDIKIVHFHDVDWEAWPLSEEELQYTVNNACACYLVADCLQNI